MFSLNINSLKRIKITKNKKHKITNDDNYTTLGGLNMENKKMKIDTYYCSLHLDKIICDVYLCSGESKTLTQNKSDVNYIN